MKRVVTLDVRGMHCGHCQHAVREALAGVPGTHVETVEIGRATVLVDNEVTDIGALIDAVDDAGYEAVEATR
jgi:copper chaperone